MLPQPAAETRSLLQLCGNLNGNVGSAFVCSYRAWSFHLDQRVRAIPLAAGYDGTRLTRDNPDCSTKPAARVANYREAWM